MDVGNLRRREEVSEEIVLYYVLVSLLKHGCFVTPPIGCRVRSEAKLAADDQVNLEPACDDRNRRLHILYDNVGTVLCKVKTGYE